jgi:UDP-GlcNAc:undecaprenyl-phosphate/decaprenyl-phosphate GlcNAc-1-phosphate transferase
MTFLLEYLLLNNLLFSLIPMVAVMAILIFFYDKEYTQVRKQIQNIHGEKRVLRIGGIILIISLMIQYFFLMDTNSLYNLILISSLPIVVVGAFEDTIGFIKPTIRLFIILMSSVIFFYFMEESFPYIDLPLIGEIIHIHPLFTFIFFTLSLSAYTNGVNMIDGTNGLAAVSIVSSLASVAFISFMVGDFEIMYLSMFFSIFLVPFLIFNYPWGKIFLGDAGAYFFGWVTGIIVILFFGRNNDVPALGAALILFYPSFELIFSFTRKILSSKSPFQPDASHLHMKVFYVFMAATNRQKRSNGLVMPFLSSLWLIPPMSIPWVFTDSKLILAFILLLVIIYLSFYYALPNQLSTTYSNGNDIK